MYLFTRYCFKYSCIISLVGNGVIRYGWFKCTTTSLYFLHNITRILVGISKENSRFNCQQWNITLCKIYSAWIFEATEKKNRFDNAVQLNNADLCTCDHLEMYSVLESYAWIELLHSLAAFCNLHFTFLQLALATD